MAAQYSAAAKTAIAALNKCNADDALTAIYATCAGKAKREVAIKKGLRKLVNAKKVKLPAVVRDLDHE